MEPIVPGSPPALALAGAPARDPAPTPPQKPLPFDCCESGCAVCVYDRYAEELAHYHGVLAQWQARHRDGEPGAG